MNTLLEVNSSRRFLEITDEKCNVVWEGWADKIEAGKHASLALNGKPFAFVPYADFAQEFMGFQTSEKVHIRHPQDKGRAANPAAAVAARLPVQRVKPPVLLIAGQDDRVWNSVMMTHNIAERRTSANLETVSLIYTDAGHDLGYRLRSHHAIRYRPMKGRGTPMSNAHSQADAWPKTIAFTADVETKN